MADYSAGYWITENTRTIMSRGYTDQTVERRVRAIAEAAERELGIPGFADEIEQDILKGWVSLSSPVWSNFGTDKGLPISCNNSHFGDTIEDILWKTAEIGEMSKMGAGTSAYLGELRPRGAKVSTGGTSLGPVHFMGPLQEVVSTISQANVRRGNCGVYLDVEHPDISEFLECREEGNHIQHLSMGVCIGDAWWNEMLNGDPLLDATKAKRAIWRRILKKRKETGYPYIFWRDNVNRRRPQALTAIGLFIKSSNLCSEITQPSTDDMSFVCCLASMNALHYRAWKDTGAVRRLAMLLDAVMGEYIRKIRALPRKAFLLMEAALNAAERCRSIGIGVLGWHSLLQSEMIPFESMQAKFLNTELFRHIDTESLAASKEMAARFGEPDYLKGYGERWMFRCAVAPTTSSSSILDFVSPSIEPENSNYYTKDLQKGKFTYRNPFLKELLASKGRDDHATWHSILVSGGSVQHLDCLSRHEKDVFKTFGEISQMEIIIQAGARQRFIDQSQSLNIMIHPEEKPKAVHDLMVAAHEMGIKTMYYQRSTNPAQEFARSLATCVSCEA